MNLARQIEQYLAQPLMELVRDISMQAEGRGERAYLVGGVVRDMLLGIAAPNPASALRFDLDLVIEGDAVELAQRVAATGRARLLARHRFGTAKLRSGTLTLDLATARSETYARPGALPTVSPGALQADLARRDFSINAMAISLAIADDGELIDPHQGRADLDHGLIRVLHPASFSDDATRILRAIRYEQRLAFELEAETGRLLRRDIPMLDTISGDRIRHELDLILKEDRPESAIQRLGELKALARIGPCLRGNGRIAGQFARARAAGKPGQLPWLYFCLLIHPCSDGDIEQLVDRLNTPAKLTRAMCDTVRLKDDLHLLDNPALKPGDIYDLLHVYDPLAVQANAIASKSTAVHKHLRLFLTKLRLVRPLLDGEDLKRLGIASGPEMGRILKSLHRARLEGEIKTRTDEERLALALLEAGRGPTIAPD
jgi:tRNA nucleotidyltransferase (CCA-adding enzyme)